MTIENAQEGAKFGIGTDHVGTIPIDGGTIQNSGTVGVQANGGQVDIGGTRIVNSQGDGIHAHAGAILRVGGATIENNGGHGIHISDVSLGSFDPSADPSQILNNGGWGVFCDGPPAVAMVSGAPGNVDGNTDGQVSCPNTP